MTTEIELGEMLITGKQLQACNKHTGCWKDKKGVIFDLGNVNYRLKPTITYYRVYRTEWDSEVFTAYSAMPFVEFDSWTHHDRVHIHDFEIEE